MRNVVLLGSLALVACGPDVGSCDPAEARRVVYEQVTGEPAFVGQAAMIRSCGAGGFCHSSGIDVESRRGAPAGLDYDLRLASNSDAPAPEATERLRRARFRAIADRYAIWDQVASGRMPIGGPIGAQVLGAAPTYEHRDLGSGERRLAPSLDEEEGLEAFRNWLACGLPVVERTQPAMAGAMPVEPVGLVVSSQEDPLEPSWADIYERLVVPRCATAPCHGESEEAGLDLRGGSEATLTRLLDGRSSGPDHCGPLGGAWLVAGAPDASLFFGKLAGVDAAGEPICGAPMPQSGGRLSTPSLENVRAWIEAGAAP